MIWEYSKINQEELKKLHMSVWFEITRFDLILEFWNS